MARGTGAGRPKQAPKGTGTPRTKRRSPFAPPDIPLSLKMKLGSILVHTDELLNELVDVEKKRGVAFDMAALNSLLADAEIVEFLAAIDPALLPVKR